MSYPQNIELSTKYSHFSPLNLMGLYTRNNPKDLRGKIVYNKHIHIAYYYYY